MGGPADIPLFNVADEHRLRIYVRVPQSYSARVKPGMTAAFSVPEYPGRTFTGQPGDHGRRGGRTVGLPAGPAAGRQPRPRPEAGRLCPGPLRPCRRPAACHSLQRPDLQRVRHGGGDARTGRRVAIKPLVIAATLAPSSRSSRAFRPRTR
ncbi:MAG: hypothetical protein WDM92_00180 [Caulobacteraceae bacterium]